MIISNKLVCEASKQQKRIDLVAVWPDYLRIKEDWPLNLNTGHSKVKKAITIRDNVGGPVSGASKSHNSRRVAHDSRLCVGLVN